MILFVLKDNQVFHISKYKIVFYKCFEDFDTVIHEI